MVNNAILPTSGFTTGAYEVANAVNVFEQSISIPYVDLPTESILDITRTFGSVNDDTESTTDGLSWQQLMWASSVSDPRWGITARDDMAISGAAGPGLTFCPVPYVRLVNIIITNTPAGISEWFPNGAIAKYGYIVFGRFEKHSLQWINFDNQAIKLPYAEFDQDGFWIYLLPGVQATWKASPANFPQRINPSMGSLYPAQSGFPY